jgi:hypothetical protein
MQGLLIAIAVGLLMFAGYSWGRSTGFDQGRATGTIDAPAEPGMAQTVVLAVLGVGALAGAFLLQRDGVVVVPTTAKLDALAGRAEQAMVEKAEQIAGGSSRPPSADPARKASAAPPD